jgi:hypothetical protein
MIVGPTCRSWKSLPAFLFAATKGQGSDVSIQRHLLFGKERVRKVGSGLGDQTGNGRRKSIDAYFVMRSNFDPDFYIEWLRKGVGRLG